MPGTRYNECGFDGNVASGHVERKEDTHMPRKKTEATDGTPALSAPRRRATRTAAPKTSNGTAAPPVNGSAHVTSPSYEQIAEAAYFRYLNRGGGDGADFDDWVVAERELSSGE